MPDPVVLITTADEVELQDGDLERLLASLSEDCRVIVSLRRVSDSWAERVEANPRVIGVVRTGMVGISEARNRGLDWVAKSGLDDSDHVVIGFPDDDCTYPAGLTGRLEAAFAASGADVVIGCYAPTADSVDRERFPAQPMSIRGWGAVDAISSVGIFARWRTLRDFRFNEVLGVGANLPAGEEIDLVLRLVAARFCVVYEPDLIVLHPYRNGADGYARMEAWLGLTTGHALARPRQVGHAARAWVGLLARVAARRITPARGLEIARRAANHDDLRAIRNLVVEAGKHA